MAHLFVYGTLTDKPRLYKIAGKSFPTSPACLKDFKKLASRFGYPYIIPEKGSVVEGLLIRNIDEQSLERIDRYEDEGRLYYRKEIQVVSAGEEIRCETYVGNPKFLDPRH